MSQVSLTLTTLGKPGKEWNDALGYELSNDALRFLRSVNFPKGKKHRLGTCLGFGRRLWVTRARGQKLSGEKNNARLLSCFRTLLGRCRRDAWGNLNVVPQHDRRDGS